MAFIPGAVALASAAGTTATMAGLTIASTAATVIGTGITAYGMLKQGKAQQQEADYSAQIDDNNAVLAGYAAIQERQQAEREAESINEQRIRNLGSQRAAAGRSGLTISGSVVDVMTDSAIQAEREIQMAKYRGDVSAYNRANEANNYRSSAALKRMSGANARSASRWSAAGTLISGFSSAGASYASFARG